MQQDKLISNERRKKHANKIYIKILLNKDPKMYCIKLAIILLTIKGINLNQKKKLG